MIKFEELIESVILPLVAYPEDVEIIKVKEEGENLEPGGNSSTTSTTSTPG